MSTSKQLARDVKKTTRGAERDIQRECQALDRQEKQLILDIKKAAKSGDKKGTNMYAKQLAQLRNTRTRLMGMSSHVKAAGMQATTLASNAAAMSAISKTTQVMANVNSATNNVETAKMLANFQKESTKMDLNMESLDEFLEDAFEDSDVEEEADEIVSATLAGIGIDLGAMMADAPTRAPPTQVQIEQPIAEENNEAADLEARFAALSS
mmetsp:Transcript_25503/g.33203  ORF Transcript_25503/g.33203 Transcript_25503/m.33203 type:complete len:210 (+) Transcript_25503:70-699(+)